MQAFPALGSKKRRAEKNVKIGGENKDRSWKYMYKNAPEGNITLEEFELYSFDRLTLLRLIDNWKARGVKPDELRNSISTESNTRFGAKPEEDKKDHISHHVLRLAFCQDDNMRTWFTQQECTLFEHRLQGLTNTEYQQLLKINNINVEMATSTEVDTIKSELEQVLRINFVDKMPNVANHSFYKVPFTDVLSLVSKRKVFIKAGFAYLISDQLIALISQHFKAMLKESLDKIAQHKWAALQETEGDRLVPFLKAVSNKSLYSSSEFKALKTLESDHIVPEQIDALAKQSFPLCMKSLHKKLRENHHLKHSGRMQYGLFLKGIGLNLDDALRFWRDEFTKLMTVDKFDKSYAYNVRHNYGKEGKRTNYTPYSCVKIITGVAAPDHGCPFKHFDADNLRKTINAESNKVTSAQMDEIIDLVNKQNYQIACRKYFELTHPPIPAELQKEDQGVPFSHPNLYYQMSRKIIETKKNTAPPLPPKK